MTSYATRRHSVVLGIHFAFLYIFRTLKKKNKNFFTLPFHHQELILPVYFQPYHSWGCVPQPSEASVRSYVKPQNPEFLYLVHPYSRSSVWLSIKHCYYTMNTVFCYYTLNAAYCYYALTAAYYYYILNVGQMPGITASSKVLWV